METSSVKSFYEKLSAFQIRLAVTINLFFTSRFMRIAVICLLPIAVVMLIVGLLLVIKGLMNGWDADSLSILIGFVLIFAHSNLIIIYVRYLRRS